MDKQPIKRELDENNKETPKKSGKIKRSELKLTIDIPSDTDLSLGDQAHQNVGKLEQILRNNGGIFGQSDKMQKGGQDTSSKVGEEKKHEIALNLETPSSSSTNRLEIKSHEEISKAFKEADSRFKELEHFKSISNDLEGIHDASVPAELKQFREEFNNFEKSLQQLRESLNSKEGKTDEELSKMCWEIDRHRRKLESYRENYRKGALQDYINLNWVDDKKPLAVSASFPNEKIKALVFAGIKHVVDMRTDRDTGAYNKDIPVYHETLKEHGINVYHLPIVEHKTTDANEMHNGAEWVNERLDKGEPVLIHCSQGRGRSVLLAIWSLAKEGMKLHEACEQVYKKRPVANLSATQQFLLWDTFDDQHQHQPSRVSQTEVEKLRQDFSSES